MRWGDPYRIETTAENCSTEQYDPGQVPGFFCGDALEVRRSEIQAVLGEEGVFSEKQRMQTELEGTRAQAIMLCIRYRDRRVERTRAKGPRLKEKDR